MLRVSIHAGPLASISTFNRTDWVDIGYKQLGELADYKVVLFKIGEGVLSPTELPAYPRWSSSLWDLSARAIARALYPRPTSSAQEAKQDLVPEAKQVAKKRAFAETLSAVIQHLPNSGGAIRRVGAMEIVEHKSKRCQYRALIEEDLQKTRRTELFTFAPAFLQPSELVMRAVMFSLSGSIDVMPPRPALSTPATKLIAGTHWVSIHRMKEPARTGFIRWLHRINEPPVTEASAPEGLARWDTFHKFLTTAI